MFLFVTIRPLAINVQLLSIYISGLLFSGTDLQFVYYILDVIAFKSMTFFLSLQNYSSNDAIVMFSFLLISKILFIGLTSMF